MEKQLVKFFVMRHGLKDGDALTPEGIEQVIASAKANLQGIEFDAALCSEMKRAWQTVDLALDTLGQREGGIVVEEGFGYEWATKGVEPLADAVKRVDELKDKGEVETVAMWLKQWPPAAGLRGRVWQTLLGTAKLLVAARGFKEDGEVYNILVGSHSPTGEMAALNPETMPRLREADIATYEVTVEPASPRAMWLRATLTNSTVLKAPY